MSLSEAVIVGELHTFPVYSKKIGRKEWRKTEKIDKYL